MAWLSGWDKRLKVTVDSSLIDAAQTHFRITLMLNSSSGKTNKNVNCILGELGSNANRKKIAITKADGTTELYVEIEHWDYLRENAVLHISKSDWEIASGTDTDLYIYYDSTHADNTTYVSDSSNSNIWDANYKIANHLATYYWTEYKYPGGVYTDADAREMIAEPALVYDDGDWHMWVNPNVSPAEAGHNIDYLTSADNGQSFTRHGTTTLDLDCPFVYHNTDNDTTDMAGAVADDGGALTDETTEANEATANDMTLLPAAPALNDAYYFLCDGDAKSLVVNVGTAGVKGNTNYVLIWEYYDGDSYEALSDVVDGTSEFTIAGTNTVSYTRPADSAKVAVNGITAYPIRARVSSVVDDQTGYTQPKGTQAWTVYKFWLTALPYIVAPNRYKDGVSLYVASSGLKFELNKDEWLPRGAAEEWDDTLMGNRWMWKEGGSFHMWYEAGSTGWTIGLATSSDGLTWTKGEGNPVDTTALPGALTGGPTAIKVGSTYCLITHHAMLYKTTDKTNFTAIAGSSNPYIYRTLAGELTQHILDPFMLEVGGSTYIYYNSGYDFINLVKIPTTASECMANYVSSIRNAPDDVDIIDAIYDSDGSSATSEPIYSRGRKSVDGISGTALQFLGKAAIDVPQKSITGNATFLARIKLDTIDKRHIIASNSKTGTHLPNYVFDITDNNFARLLFYKAGDVLQSVTGDIALAADTWYTIIGTYDGSALKIYVNADLDEQAVASGVPYDMDEYYRVGSHHYAGGESSVYMELTLDELCILDTDKSAAWVKATHHNLNDSLLTYGDEEAIGGWLIDWAKRIEINIDYTNKIGGSVTWLPIAIIIESGLAGVGNKDVSCIFDELTSDANRLKIAVTKADGLTQLYVEIEEWDDANENAVLHVSRSGWTISADTSVFIYYDSAQGDNSTYVADIATRTEVWDNDFKMVQHLKGAAFGDLDDSTSNNNDVSAAGGTPGYDTDAKIGKGVEFVAASSEYLKIPDAASLDTFISSLTIEVWFKSDIFAESTLYALLAKYTAIQPSYYLVTYDDDADSNHQIRGYANDGVNSIALQGTNNLSTGVTYYGAFTVNGATGDAELWLNEASDGSTGSSVEGIVDYAEDVYIAARNAGTANFFDGIIDEVRISGTVRSDAWKKASYNSGNDSLLTYGDGEVVAVAGAFYQRYNPLGINMYSAGQVRGG